MADAASAGGRFCRSSRHRGEEPATARVPRFLSDSLWRSGFGGCSSRRPVATNHSAALVTAGRPPNGLFHADVGALLRSFGRCARPKARRGATDPAGLAAGPQLLGPLRCATRRAHRDVDSPSPHRCGPLRLLAHNHRNTLRFTHAAHPCARRPSGSIRGGRLAGRIVRLDAGGVWDHTRNAAYVNDCPQYPTDRNVDDQTRAKRRRYWCS